MKRILGLTLILSIIILPTLVSAREISFDDENLLPNSISGTITDYDEVPLSNVTVKATTTIDKIDLSFEALTDSSGVYAFYDLPLSEDGYTVIASSDGYCSNSKDKIKIGSILNMKLYKSSLIIADSPIIFVSAGQSGGVILATFIADEVGIEYDWADSPYSKHLSSGVGLLSFNKKTDVYLQYHKKSNFPDRTQYKTIIFVIGNGLLGFPCNGIKPETELARIKDNIAWAKDNNVKIIGMHIEGASLRGKPGSDNEKLIDLVAPQCDMLIVIKASNQDDKFTRIASDNNIPIEIAENARDLIPIFEEVFRKNQK